MEASALRLDLEDRGRAGIVDPDRRVRELVRGVLETAVIAHGEEALAQAREIDGGLGREQADDQRPRRHFE